MHMVAAGAGYPDMRIVEYPAPISVHSYDEMKQNLIEKVIPDIIEKLTKPVKSSLGKKTRRREPGNRDIVFEGSDAEIQEYFISRSWSDGLPIIPPTIEKVEEFLRFTDRDPDEMIGVFEPTMNACTVWKVAVNGVMAGCRPEYMPVLLAVAEVVSDPVYSVKDSGATPGWEAMIMLNGPIRDQLGFNYQLGVQRPGCQPNTTIGRFYRLLIRNIAGFKVGSTDMACFGQMFRAVAAENDQICQEIGWKTLAEELGYEKGENVVTITSVRAMSDPMQTVGDIAEQHLDYITERVAGIIEPYECARGYSETHVLFIAPPVAKLLASQGYDKQGVFDYINEHAKVRADYFEMCGTRFNHWTPFSIKEAVEKGDLPKAWYESDDPARMVPLISPRSHIYIIVTGAMVRNRCQFFRQNFSHGKMASRKIKLPKNWEKLLSER